MPIKEAAVRDKVKKVFGDEFSIKKATIGWRIIEETGDFSYSNVLWFAKASDLEDFIRDFEHMTLIMEQKRGNKNEKKEFFKNNIQR